MYGMAVAALAAGMNFFLSFVENEIDEMQKLALDTINKYFKGTKGEKEENIRQVKKLCNNIRSSCRTDEKVIRHLTKFIIFTLLGLSVNWMGRMCLQYTSLQTNAAGIITCVFFVTIQIVTFICLIHYGYKLLSKRKVLNEVQLYRRALMDTIFRQVPLSESIENLNMTVKLPNSK